MEAKYYLRRPGRMKKRDAVNRCLDLEMSYREYDDVTVFPVSVGAMVPYRGGVFDCDGKMIPLSTWDFVTGYDAASFKPTVNIEKAIFIGCFITTWGHCLMEGLSRLWFLCTDKGKELMESGYSVVYCLNSDRTPDYVAELFKLAGFDVLDFVHLKEVAYCGHIVIPDDSIIRTESSGRFFTKEYVGLIDRIRGNVDEIPCDKIYFSRQGPKHNPDFGEERIINLFREKGFRIIDPTTIPVKEQFGLMKGCRCFAATEGSISHNALFCKPGTEHILLRKLWRNPISYTAVVNQVADLSVSYIDANLSLHTKDIRKEYNGPFYLCINRFMERFFGEKIPHIPFFFDPVWYSYVARDPFAPIRNFLKYIGPFIWKKVRILFVNNK